MNILIQKQRINQNEINSVNARQLWTALESKREFANWIKDKLQHFVEGVDFLTISSKTAGRPLIEYHLSIDTAKHIAMIERNDKGRQIRQYFIDFENNNKIFIPQIDSKFLLQIAEEMQKKELLIEEQKNKIENQDTTIEKISNIQDTYSIREATKNLIVKENNLKEFLKKKKWFIYLSDGEESKKMYSTSYAKDNNFAIDKKVLNKGQQKFYHQFRITKHGMSYLIKNIKEI